MALINHTATGCELVSLRPYPAVSSTDSSVGVTPVVGPDGKTTYDLLIPPGIVVEPATALPVADNEVDTAIRTGIVGVSAKYAREDHNHPIKRQTMPADPVLTFTGATGSEMTASVVLDRWSTEETVTYAYRCLVNSAGGVNGWDVIRVPNLTGFQRPQITIEGTYRQAGTPNTGMSPAYYMGNEANHWSSTQGVYIGNYLATHKPVACRRYVTITVQYTRN